MTFDHTRVALRMAADIIDALAGDDDELAGFVRRQRIDTEFRRAVAYLGDPDPVMREEGCRILGRLAGDWNVFRPAA